MVLVDARSRDPPGFRYTFALNHPVQGSAAEVTQIALAEVDRALRPYDARITATVHDEIVVECGEDHATVRAVVRLLRAEDDDGVPGVVPWPPLAAGRRDQGRAQLGRAGAVQGMVGPVTTKDPLRSLHGQNGGVVESDETYVGG